VLDHVRMTRDGLNDIIERREEQMGEDAAA
jgi:hypothetical protein